MTIHLPKDVERSIEAAVHGGHFPSVDDALAEAWRAYLQHQEVRQETQATVSRSGQQRENLTRLCQLLDAMPTSTVTDVLTNRNHDEILYGQ
jgi:Arc/MetJ-type ribon-helix-helix transcriptional regulator